MKISSNEKLFRENNIRVRNQTIHRKILFKFFVPIFILSICFIFAIGFSVKNQESANMDQCEGRGILPPHGVAKKKDI